MVGASKTESFYSETEHLTLFKNVNIMKIKWDWESTNWFQPDFALTRFRLKFSQPETESAFFFEYGFIY